MRKRWMAALLCSCMVVGALTGCGSPKSTDEKEKTNTASAQAEDTGDGTEKLSIFINMSWYPQDSFTGKIPDKIKEETGVDLDVTIATDEKQLGVMIASGELPDLVYSDDTGGVLSSLSNPDVCYSLDELAEKTGVKFDDCANYKDRSDIAQTFSTDGQAYTLLNAYNTQEQWENLKVGAAGQACVYYRKDLLDKSGIKEPANLDEFKECLQEVKEAYPDVVPFGMGGETWKLDAIGNWMGVSADQYNEETGEYKYWSSTDSYKDYLKYCNELYREGAITAENYSVENEADANQVGYNSNCVFLSGYLKLTNMTGLQNNTKDENAEWAVLNPLGEGMVNDSDGWAGVFVSKNCSDPKAAAKFVSYMNSEEGSRTGLWGIEGDDYTVDEEGVPTFSEKYLEARNDTDKWNNDYNGWFYFGTSAIDEIYSNYCGADEDVVAQFTAYGEGYKNYPEIGISKPLSSSVEGVIKTKLDDLKKMYEAKVIFTDSDDAFESAYKEYMEANEKTGVEKYNAYMTEKIKEVKEKFGI